jgi:hypothetical protein
VAAGEFRSRLSKDKRGSSHRPVRLMVGASGPRFSGRPMPPLELNDSEMSMLLTLSAPIDQRLRPQFLQEVAQRARGEATGRRDWRGFGAPHGAHGSEALFRFASAWRKQVSAGLGHCSPSCRTKARGRSREEFVDLVSRQNLLDDEKVAQRFEKGKTGISGNFRAGRSVKGH